MDDQPRDMVFDLDGVLSTRDTFSALMTTYAARRPARIVRALPALAQWLRTRGNTHGNAAAARRMTAVLLQGLDPDSYHRLAQELGGKWGSNQAWVRRNVANHLDDLRSAGHRIVVATATEHQLAAAFLTAAGATPDLLVASELHWDGHGAVQVGRHLRGAAKLDALLDAGVHVAGSRFFTDSWDDHPTAHVAAELVLVHPPADTVTCYNTAGFTFELLPAGSGHRSNGR